MRTQGHYTIPGPRMPGLPRGVEIALAVAVVVIAGAGLLMLIYRPAEAPRAAPAVARPVVTAPAVPELPVVAPNVRFADEILAARAAPVEIAAPAPAWTGPATYALPRATPDLWAFCRACADEALGALRMPAAPVAAAAPPRLYVVAAPVPDTQAICARNRIFADEVIASATTVVDLQAIVVEGGTMPARWVGPR